MGLFEIVEKIGEVVYRLNPPLQLDDVHIVTICPCLRSTHATCNMLPYAEISHQIDVTYEEQPTEILAREVHLFHNKETPIVKVHWENHSENDAPWELEKETHEKYPYLF